MTTCAKYYQDDQQQDQILLEEQKQNIWKLLTAPSSQLKSFTLDAGDSLGKLAQFRSNEWKSPAATSSWEVSCFVVWLFVSFVFVQLFLQKFPLLISVRAAKQEELLAEFVRHAKNTLAVPPQSPEKITSVVVYKALALVYVSATYHSLFSPPRPP